MTDILRLTQNIPLSSPDARAALSSENARHIRSVIHGIEQIDSVRGCTAQTGNARGATSAVPRRSLCATTNWRGVRIRKLRYSRRGRMTSRSGSVPVSSNRTRCMRVIVRRERPHPVCNCGSPTLTGTGLTCFATSTRRPARRPRATAPQAGHVEDRIRCAKDTGLAAFRCTALPRTREPSGPATISHRRGRACYTSNASLSRSPGTRTGCNENLGCGLG
jgi:hypothetical protein